MRPVDRLLSSSGWASGSSEMSVTLYPTVKVTGSLYFTSVPFTSALRVWADNLADRTWQMVVMRENNDPVHMLHHKERYVVTLNGSNFILSIIK